MEFFSDSKEQVEQLTGDLDEMSQQLQAAHKDLQETRLKLSEETFISSKLKTTEGELYSTADKVSKQTLLVLCDCTFARPHSCHNGKVKLKHLL